MGTICAFSGHRDLSPEHTESLRRALEQAIVQLYDRGCTDFLCGGAMGFDLLAAETTLLLRPALPDLRMHLLLPCPQHHSHWPEAERTRFQQVREQCDLVRYTAGHYYRGCMLVRDRALAEAADMCLCWLTRSTGGTAYTVRQFALLDKPVINLAEKI